MYNLVEKLIKRNNKKRGFNITIATMIMFLLGSFGAVAKDVNGDFTNEEQLTEQVNIVGGNKINITNNGKITSKDISGQKNSGNGISTYFGEKGLEITTIKNTGKIQGEGFVVNADGNNSGNGIGVYSNSFIKIKTIDNSGDIFGRNQDVNAINYNNVGNGIGIWTNRNNIAVTTIKNTGNIIGENRRVNGNENNVGNGVGLYSKAQITITTIENTGNIAGQVGEVNGVTTNDYSKINAGNGVGIFGYNSVIIGDINNSGVITGKAEKIEGKGINAGNGIGVYSWSNGSEIGKINNTGVIMGSNSAISVETIGMKNSTGTITNSGILLGQKPVEVLNNEEIEIKNLGLMVTTNEKGEVTKIETKNQTSENIIYKDVNYTVINGKISETTTETIKATTLNGQKSNLILNGIDKTLTVDTNLTLDNSIINAYKTAVEITGENTFTGNNVTINGGGLDGQTPVVIGDNLDNTLILNGNSIVNGNINLGGGTDLLVFGDSKVSTYSTDNSTINIGGKIDSAETIDVNQSVVFGENSKVTGTEKINIGANGSLGLTLKIEGDKSSHALTGNNVTISGKDGGAGDILLITNGIGKGTTVDMSGLKIDESIKIGVNSILYKPEKDENGNIIIAGQDNAGDVVTPPTDGGSQPGDSGSTETPEQGGSSNLFDTLAKGLSYEDLNLIYKGAMDADPDTLNSIIGAGNTKATDSQKEYFVKYLAETYVASPYSLSAELSRKSADMFENVVIGKDLKPELSKWAVYGGFTHIDGGSQDSYYGVDNQVYTTNAYGVDTDTKLTGIYVMGEYGLQDNLIAGVIFGGNQGESELSNGSKVEGNNIYIGAFAKKYVGNLRLLAGIGYQYGDFQADRYSLGADMTRHYDSDYNDNTFDIYADAKYSHKLAENIYLEPNIGISHIYVSQDSAKESGNLGMETSSKDFNYTTLKTGVDVRKDIVTTKAKHSVSVGVFYEKMLDGAKEEKLGAKFNNSTKSMNLLVAEKNEDRVGVRSKYEVELQNGVTFDVKGSYSFARDTHQGDMKHKDNTEWRVGVGIGYKF